MKVLIVVPTYNERKNIPIFLKKLITQINRTSEILVVDDNSPDGTYNEVLKYQKKYKSIKLKIRKKKLGIGSAHKFGIKYAFSKKFEILITMDSDGTHDPKYIKKFLLKIKKFDFITTSRFKNKNSLRSWPLIRILLTNVRHQMIKFFLGMSFDASGAYRCYNLKKIKRNDILLAKDNGYSFFWESIFILYKKNYSIFEVPIVLPYRKIGSSKMKVSDILYAFIYLIKISFKKYKY